MRALDTGDEYLDLRAVANGDDLRRGFSSSPAANTLALLSWFPMPVAVLALGFFGAMAGEGSAYGFWGVMIGMIPFFYLVFTVMGNMEHGICWGLFIKMMIAKVRLGRVHKQHPGLREEADRIVSQVVSGTISPEVATEMFNVHYAAVLNGAVDTSDN